MKMMHYQDFKHKETIVPKLPHILELSLYNYRITEWHLVSMHTAMIGETRLYLDIYDCQTENFLSFLLRLLFHY